MKKQTMFILSGLIFTSCSSLNRIVTTNDPYKGVNSLKMNQELKGVSTERRNFRLTSYDYVFELKYIYSAGTDSNNCARLDLKLTTSARPETLEPEIYFEADGNKFRLESGKTGRVDFERSETTTTSSSTTEEDKKDDKAEQDPAGGNNTKKKSSSSTTTTTSTTHTSYQTIKHTFILPEELSEKLADCREAAIRVYVADEGVDIPYKGTKLAALKRYFGEVIAAIPFIYTVYR